MNDYGQGRVDACAKIATSRADFIKLVRRVTGLTASGVRECDYVQSRAKEFKV